jgi:hypothetical protein
MGILFSLGLLSCGFEPSGLDEGIEVIDNALIEAIECLSRLGTFLGVKNCQLGGELAPRRLSQRLALTS